jgi:hypothetical protein
MQEKFGRKGRRAFKKKIIERNKLWSQLADEAVIVAPDSDGWGDDLMKVRHPAKRSANEGNNRRVVRASGAQTIGWRLLSSKLASKEQAERKRLCAACSAAS